MSLNITGGLSDEDLDKQKMIQDPPSHEPGYGGMPSVDFDDEDDSFNFGKDDDDDDSFGFSKPGSSFGGLNSSSGFGSLGGSPGLGGFGRPTGLGVPGLGSSFGTPYSMDMQGQSQQQEDKKKDSSQIIFDAGKEVWSFVMEIINSFKNRNVDDWAKVSNRWLQIGGVMMLLGLISTIVGAFGDLALLKLGNLGGVGIFGGLIVLSGGLCGLGLNTYLKAKGGYYAATGGNLDELKDMLSVENDSLNEGVEDLDFGFDDGEKELDETDDTEEVSEEDLSDLMSSLFGDKSNNELPSFPIEELNNDEADEEEETKEIDYDDLLEGVREDIPFLNRQLLFDTFKDFFPLHSKKFTIIKEYDPDDDLFISMGAKINKAIEQLLPNVEPMLREVQIESLKETCFAFEVTFSRVKGGKRLKNDDLATEMLNYFREGVSDDSISITVNTIADSYVSIITKGATEVVTVGDCFNKTDVKDYILDTKHMLPFISGITDLGEVQMSDMKNYLTLAITGKPRSGKSWYVNSILTTLVAFNTPEDIQFIIVDPKKTSLFKTFSLLPHVCGLHDGNNIIDILNDLIDTEAERRKTLLSNARVDNIWEFREETGAKLPVIMLVIDEVVTINGDLKKAGLDKEFKNLIQTVLTQLPFLGIGLMMVPHRTTGVLDPLVRLNLSYKASVMADDATLKEELNVSATNWKRPLILPGDMALSTSLMKQPMYVKGTGVALNDKETRKLITQMARAWYRLGADMPDMKYIGSGYNRDEDYIKKELDLSDEKHRIQYNTLDLDLDEDNGRVHLGK